MSLSFSEKFRMTAGGRSFRMYEVTADGSTVSINASDLDLDQIEFAKLTSPQDLIGTLSITASALATVTGSTLVVTVTGAVLGDPVNVGLATDGLDLIYTGYVQAANTVEIRVDNQTAGTVTPPEGYQAIVRKSVGLKTYTGSAIVFGPALTSGDKFNLEVIGW